MKKTLLLKTLLLLCVLIVGSTSAWAQSTPDGTFIFDFYNEETLGVSSGTNLTSSNYADFIQVPTGATAKGVVTAVSTTGTVQYDKNGGLTIGTSSNTAPSAQKVIFTIAENYKVKKCTVYAAKYDNTRLLLNGSAAASGSIANKETKLEDITSPYVWTSTDGMTSLEFSRDNGNGGNCKRVTIYRIICEYDYKTDFELTYAANPVEGGSISVKNSGADVASGSDVTKLTTLNIVATPNAGYVFDSWTATEGTIDDATSATTTFTMPSEDATLTANFKKLSAVTFTASSAAGIISVKNGEEIVNSGDELVEGTTLTIKAEAGANKEFASWSITGATPADANAEETTLTVGTSDITIVATFNDVITHEIKWSVNGDIVLTENVKEGNALTFAAPASGIPEGYVYKGWVVEDNKIDTPTDTDPSANYVTAATSATDITYYCVMAEEDGVSGTATLTANWTSSSTTYGDHSYIDDMGFTWTGNTQEPKENSVSRIGLRSTSGSHLASPKFPANVTSIKMYTYNGSSTADRVMNINSSADKNNADLGTIDAPKGVKCTVEKTAVLKEDFDQFVLIPEDGSVGFSTITVTYGSATTKNYCTTVPTASFAIDPACKEGEKFYATYSNTSAFIVPGDITVSSVAVDGEGNLVITDLTKGEVVPANYGVLVSAETAGDKTIVLSSKAGTSHADQMLYASSESLTAAQMATAAPNCEYYRLTMHNGTIIGFWWGAEDGASFAIAANKAYLAVPKGATAKAGFAFNENVANGINTLDNLTNSQLDNNAPMYNLAGQRVTKSYKGVVIQNGKKYIQK